MRATQLVSRRQEYRADELACALAGSSALISGLRLIEGSSVALSLFWRSEIAPALEVGCRLPIAEGFARFIALPKIAAAISKHVETELNATGTFPYDSHPPLRNRLVAAASFPGQPQPESNAPAVTLFDDVDRLEVKLLEMMAPHLELASLKLVAWERIGPEVYLPSWRTFVAECGRALVGIKVEEVPEMGEDPKALIAQMRDPKGTLLTREQRADRARALLWTAFAHPPRRAQAIPPQQVTEDHRGVGSQIELLGTTRELRTTLTQPQRRYYFPHNRWNRWEMFIEADAKRRERR